MGIRRRAILLEHRLVRRIEKLTKEIEKIESEFYNDNTFKGFIPVIKIPPMNEEQKRKFIEDYEAAMQSSSSYITIIDETI